MPWPSAWGDDWVVPPGDLVAAAKWLAWRLLAWVRRHPRVSLVGGALLIVVAPLLGDLFFVLPWPVRKRLGWALFLTVVAVCLARLAMVRQGDDPPPDDPLPARGVARLWPFLLFALCASLAWPMVRDAGNLGFGDWDLFLGKVEAARRTVLLYGQFPWWDPWSRGGFPLAANPQCGVMGLAMPFILAFGSTTGMGIGTIISFALAAEGARRLGRLWLGDPMASFAVGLVYSINGAMLVAAVAAYHLSMCYFALPWMLYHVFQMHRDRWSGAWLGLWMGLSLLNGIQYFTVYMPLIAGVAWLRALRAREGDDRRRLVAGTVVAVGVFLAITGWRLATTGLVYRDFPRELPTGMDESWDMVVRYLLYRRSASYLRATEIPHFWETNCYIGLTVVVLALVSLAWGWRWWHTLTLVCVVLAVGSAHWYHPSYWLAKLPFFATMHVVSRWRFMAILGVALAVGQALAALRRSDWPWLRVVPPAALLVITIDYVSLGFEVLPVAYSVPQAERLYPGPPLPRGEVAQVLTGLGYPAISRGYGVIYGYEPMMGYERGTPTKRLWRDHPDYVGEHWTADGPTRPLEWTPNRVVLQVRPNQDVFINQNPGSWWVVNGARAWPDWRAAEKERVFSARADDTGRLVAEIAPKGLEAGLALHALGAVLAGAGLVWGRRVGARR